MKLYKKLSRYSSHQIGNKSLGKRNISLMWLLKEKNEV
jgi:hypothetical protein